MFFRTSIKTVFGKASRSGLYYLLICKLPVRRATDTETESDALGGVLVIGLLAGLVDLMRCLLTN
jgi:hypothetical protein